MTAPTHSTRRRCSWPSSGVIAVAAAAAAAAAAAVLLPVARADSVLYNSSAYESGALGTGPNQTFISTGSSFVAPILNYLTNSSAATSGLVFLTWYRNFVTNPVIVDAASGSIVYVGPVSPATGFSVQEYKGEP
ncbi:hypothetical protein HK405_005833, partial [Cladochytrium tenue]